MPNDAEIEAKFWKALKSDMTLFLGLVEGEGGHARPMTSQLDDDDDGRGPIWFFSSKDNDLVQKMGGGARALAHFVSKDHELWASFEGQLYPDNDRATIDRLWNPYAAAWYEEGKDDPKLQLIRLEPDHAQIWLNENSMFAGIKTLLGSDPKKDYQDKVAEVNLS